MYYTEIKSTSDKAKEIILNKLEELNINNSTQLFNYIEGLDSYEELLSIYGNDLSTHAIMNAYTILRRDIQIPIATFTKMCKVLDIEWGITVVHPFLSKKKYTGYEMILSRIVQECSYHIVMRSPKLEDTIIYSGKAPISFSLFTKAMNEMEIAFKFDYKY